MHTNTDTDTDDPGYDGDVDADSDSDVTASVSSDEDPTGDSESSVVKSSVVESGSPASVQEPPASETPEDQQAREEDLILDAIDNVYDWNLTTDDELMAILKVWFMTFVLCWTWKIPAVGILSKLKLTLVCSLALIVRRRSFSPVGGWLCGGDFLWLWVWAAWFSLCMLGSWLRGWCLSRDTHEGDEYPLQCSLI